MNFDKRFALIDSEGQRRYAQLLDGTFQIGKDREESPTELLVFARRILREGKSGRFTRSDGSKHGVLALRPRGREAVGWELDPQIAARIGVLPAGRVD